MVGPAPTATFTLTADIAAGSNVPVSLSGPIGILQVGDVLVLDQANSQAVEACVIASTTNPPNPSPAITLQKVINAHVTGAKALLGLVIEEQKYMPASRPLTFVSRSPLMNVISGVGRYAYGRRGDSSNYNMEQFNLLAAVSKFGGPPVWELFQSAYPSGWDVQTGQVWVPAGIMLAYYSEVKLRYVAGFPASAIPDAVKMAVASMIPAMIANPVKGNVKMFKAGDTSVTNFAASIMNDDTKTALAPFAARVYS
jgi:hypothetical protein